jgi:hypothetical protein
MSIVLISLLRRHFSELFGVLEQGSSLGSLSALEARTPGDSASGAESGDSAGLRG